MGVESFILPALQFLGSLGSGSNKISLSKLDNQSAINYKWATQLADYQYDLQKKQFDYTNEYNLPENQVNRLISANLNPNLAYSSGSVVGSTASMPSVSQPRMNQVDPSALLNYQLQSKQLAMQSAQTMANILRTQEETRGLSIENARKEAESPYFAENAQYQNQMLFYTLGNLKNTNRLGAFDVEFKEQEAEVKRYLIYYDNQEKPESMSYDEWYRLERLADSPIGQAIRYELEIKKTSKEKLEKDIEYIGKQISYIGHQIDYMSEHAAIEKVKRTLWDCGINPDDPVWLRALVQWLGGKEGIIEQGKKVAGGTQSVFDTLRDYLSPNFGAKAEQKPRGGGRSGIR